MTIKPTYVRKYILDRWGIFGVRKYAKNTAWMFVGHSTTVLSFAVNIFLARQLGPETFGALNYIIAFVGIFAFISTAGLHESLQRDFAKSPDRQAEITSTATLILILSSSLAWVSTLLAVIFFEGNNELKILMILYSTIYLWTPINTTISSLFLANIQSKYVALTQVIVITTVSILRILLLLFTKDLTLFIATYALEPALYTLSYYLRSRKMTIWKTPLKIDKEFVIQMVYSGVLLTLSTGLTYLLLRIDQIMIKSIMNDAAVGYYSAAVRLSELWYFLPNLIVISLLPALINAHKTEERQYKKRLKYLYLLLLTIGVAIATFTSLLAPWLIKILYGELYSSSISTLSIYTWSTIGFFLTAGINKQLLTEHKHVKILAYVAIAVTANVILNALLIPKTGLVGAAWASLISYSIIPIIHLILSLVRKEPRK